MQWLVGHGIINLLVGHSAALQIRGTTMTKLMSNDKIKSVINQEIERGVKIKLKISVDDLEGIIGDKYGAENREKFILEYASDLRHAAGEYDDAYCAESAYDPDAEWEDDDTPAEITWGQVQSSTRDFLNESVDNHVLLNSKQLLQKLGDKFGEESLLEWISDREDWKTMVLKSIAFQKWLENRSDMALSDEKPWLDYK